MSTLLDTVKGLITPELIAKVSHLFGGDESQTKSVIGAAIPTILKAIIGKASSENGSSISELARQAAGTNVLENPQNTPEMPNAKPGMNWLTSLLGDKAGMVVQAISTFTGGKATSVESILKMLTPMCLASVGKQAATNGLSASGFTSWLSSQKEDVQKIMPAGLNLHGLLGGKCTCKKGDKTSCGCRWLWILLGLLALALILFFWKGCGACKSICPSNTTEKPAATTSITEKVVEEAREWFKVQLVDGISIDAYKGGVESELVSELNKTEAIPADKEIWYGFDNLNFETGSNKLAPSSVAQVKNIVAILKAYPKTKIKIGGYTDKTGSDEINLKLSQERADAVFNAIKEQGGNPEQLLEAKGYGSQFAKFPADAPDEDRKKDRHISLGLKEK